MIEISGADAERSSEEPPPAAGNRFLPQPGEDIAVAAAAAADGVVGSVGEPILLWEVAVAVAAARLWFFPQYSAASFADPQLAAAVVDAVVVDGAAVAAGGLKIPEKQPGQVVVFVAVGSRKNQLAGWQVLLELLAGVAAAAAVVERVAVGPAAVEIVAVAAAVGNVDSVVAEAAAVLGGRVVAAEIPNSMKDLTEVHPKIQKHRLQFQVNHFSVTHPRSPGLTYFFLNPQE